jgi:hypothetical protein
MKDRLRQRRDVSRRSRAIEAALRNTQSSALRDELMAVANRKGF